MKRTGTCDTCQAETSAGPFCGNCHRSTDYLHPADIPDGLERAEGFDVRCPTCGESGRGQDFVADHRECQP